MGGGWSFGGNGRDGALTLVGIFDFMGFRIFLGKRFHHKGAEAAKGRKGGGYFGCESVKLPDFDNFHTVVGIQDPDSINRVTKFGMDLIYRCVAAS